MPETEQPPAPEESVGPLERGLAVLRAMAADPGPRQRPGDLVRATGLARSTVDRIAATLTALDYLRTEGRDLVIAPRLLELGNGYLASCGLPDALTPYAVRLADRLDESVSIAVPDGDGARFIAQATRRRTMSVAFRIGDLLPAERCAPGALFAAHWDDARRARWRARRAADPRDTGFPAVPPPAPDRHAEQHFADRVRAAHRDGHAVDDQLIEPGLVAVAVPVHDPDGTVVCAVSVVSHTSRHSAASLADHALPQLLATAREMEAALKAPPASTPRGLRAPVDESELKTRLGPEFLQSLARGLAVLHALGTAPGGATLSETAQATGLARATARRALITLRHLDYVHGDDRRFLLTPRVLELGYARLGRSTLADLARPHLAELAVRVQESASVAVLDGTDVRYTARVSTGRIMSVDLTVGTRLPAYATSMGRVLLAGLPAPARTRLLDRSHPQALTARTRTSPADLAEALREVEREGYALVDEELEEGLRSIAVPLHDRAGHVVAALNIAQHAGRGTPADLVEHALPALRDTAARITADLAAVTERHPLVLG